MSTSRTPRPLDGATPVSIEPETAESPNSDAFRPPPRRGRHVYLRPVTPEDYGRLRMLELGEELGVRWRFRGSTPPAERWQPGSGILAQFLVVRQGNHRAIGIASIYQYDFQDQHAYLAAATFEPGQRSPLMVHGLALFLNYVFTCWNFRKLYLELPEYNVTRLSSSLGDLLVEEGRLREDIYYDGRWWDKVTLSLYRERWKQRAERALTAALPPTPRVASVRLPDITG